MERGILWLPLLGVFVWLAWAGWNEYRKLEAYKVWAADFERCKYDVYAALGQAGDQLVWGCPTRRGLDQIQQVSLYSIKTIELYRGKNPPKDDVGLPRGCEICLQLTLDTGSIRAIPFTDLELATRWQKQLQSLLESLESTPHP
ncbi:MAG: hypothetical protein AAGE59_00010 [Cyanobacteria bacterium P01_F01_bin.86]